ncbi:MULTISPECIES: MASE1 domain-containing protein [unclassified Synechocystis]|uniref:sensor domain-containing diguanylate cyclase n=1 Tax=unclassified Synechocystis TaxID=2640012 RepID=UPI00040CB1E7|nr:MULTISPECIES: MASE1 domain-containing protein [unclassified Synechocystis]AIE72917.1 Two-component response regulator [Synechocystis sp. PCC 6714]MCT0252602.1 MASE1 domain-containing protein [Synechocystis sp. CS-94]
MARQEHWAPIHRHGLVRWLGGSKTSFFLQSPLLHNILLNLLVALFYVVGIKLSDQLVSTLLPGRIAPVWFPSALTFGVFFHFGHWVTPGIILGSVLGLISVLSTFDPPPSITQFLVLETAFAFANTIQPFVGDLWLKNKLKLVAQRESVPIINDSDSIREPLAILNPFQRLSTTIAFVQGALIGPFLSAVIGVSTLLFLGIVTWEKFFYSWITWWSNSFLAIIVFSPVLITVRFYQFRRHHLTDVKLILSIALTVLIWFLSFYKSYPVAYMFLPLILFVVFHFGEFFASVFVAFFAFFAIFTTAQGQGIFIHDSGNNSVIFLQMFTGVISMTALFFSAVIEEKKIAQQSLAQAVRNLENEVKRRTERLTAAKKSLEIANIELNKLAHIDGLTHVPNRRYFEQQFPREWEAFLQRGNNLTVMMVDVDYFKLYNDHYGHGQGDICLTEIAQILQSCIRQPGSDFIARYGGEEFILVLPEVGRLEAIAIAQRIKITLQAEAIPHLATGNGGNVTCSIGIAVACSGFEGDSETLLKQADQALYLAKQAGRNQYVLFSDCETEVNIVGPPD